MSILLLDKGKPGASRGRKATGPTRSAGLPHSKGPHPCCPFWHPAHPRSRPSAARALRRMTGPRRRLIRQAGQPAWPPPSASVVASVASSAPGSAPSSPNPAAGSDSCNTRATRNGTSTQTATGTATSVWAVTDARGTGEAWDVSVTATVPTSAAGTALGESTDRTIAVGNLTITPGTITAAAGADSATNISAPALPMLTTPQPLISSTGSSKGTYNLTPTFSLDIPANAFRSNWPGVVGTGTLNPYISTITYTIA